MVIDRFNPDHPARKSFSSVVEDLNVYFHTRISKDVERFLCAAYVAYDDQKDDIIGYFTLSQHSIENDHKDERNKGRYENVPATLLGRLAVDKKYAGQGNGTKIMRVVFEKHVAIARQVGSAVLIIESLPEAIGFYQTIPIIREEKIADQSTIFTVRTKELINVLE